MIRTDTTKRSVEGMSLVEVLIALAILAIGVMALANLQGSSLRMSSQAEILKTSTQIAEGEVEWRRQTEVTVGQDMECDSFVPSSHTCTVSVVPCNSSGASLECQPGLAAPAAYEITVTVENDRVSPFVLRTVSTGSFVAGIVSDGTVVPPEGGGEPDPEPDPDPDPDEPDDGDDDEDSTPGMGKGKGKGGG